jgi:hypothetical protein
LTKKKGRWYGCFAAHPPEVVFESIDRQWRAVRKVMNNDDHKQNDPHH